MNKGNKDFEKKLLTKKSVDTSRWYTEVIQLAELADYGPARGTMVIRPYGYAIWENVQFEFNRSIEELGVENAYFPLFIPMSLLKKEKTHVKGFAPELAVVTHGGGKKLLEPLVVRPTSETVMYQMYAKWISSWRDLPLKINQWNNVVRWEKRTYFFLRTLEFLWQEGHTAHADYEEAEQMTRDALNAYEKLYKEEFAMPGLTGVKSNAEKFAGADHTYTIEFLMPDGKILQGATSHHLGDNFSKVFDINFQDKNGKSQYVQQTSWGLSTRSLGGMILMHGDDNGLIIPPKLAPIKVVIIPVLGKKDKEIFKFCEQVEKEIKGAESSFPGRVDIAKDSEKSFGWKVNEADIKGIPLKISVGTRELDEKTVTISPRLNKLTDKLVKISDLGDKVEEMLSDMQDEMYRNAEKNLYDNIHETKDYKEFKKIMNSKRGYIKAFWCEDAKCEEKIKDETKATTRLKDLDAKKKNGKCIYCDKKASYIWYFGQAY
jgi:prolyl-tRNA synthetase